MSRQSAEKWYASQKAWHDKRRNEEFYACLESQTVLASREHRASWSWHRQESNYYLERLAALSVKGK